MLNKERIVNLIVRPHKEWSAILSEQNTPLQLFLKYFLPLLAIPVFALVIGYALVGKSSGDAHFSILIKGWQIGFQKALTYAISTPVALFLSALLIDYLAPVFRSSRAPERSMILVIYSWTPVLLAGVFYFIPAFGFMFYPAVIFAFVVMWHGLPVMKQTPDASRTAYFLAMVIVIVCVLAICHSVIFKPLIGAFWVGESYYSGMGL